MRSEAVEARRAFGQKLLAAMEGGRLDVDFNLRMGLVDVMQDRPIRPSGEPVLAWRDEDERLFRERFGRVLVEAFRTLGTEIPSEIAYRMLVWLLTGPE